MLSWEKVSSIFYELHFWVINILCDLFVVTALNQILRDMFCDANMEWSM